jgi:hypothetical protein
MPVHSHKAVLMSAFPCACSRFHSISLFGRPIPLKSFTQHLITYSIKCHLQVCGACNRFKNPEMGNILEAPTLPFLTWVFLSLARLRHCRHANTCRSTQITVVPLHILLSCNYVLPGLIPLRNAARSRAVLPGGRQPTSRVGPACGAIRRNSIQHPYLGNGECCFYRQASVLFLFAC